LICENRSNGNPGRVTPSFLVADVYAAVTSKGSVFPFLFILLWDAIGDPQPLHFLRKLPTISRWEKSSICKLANVATKLEPRYVFIYLSIFLPHYVERRLFFHFWPLILSLDMLSSKNNTSKSILKIIRSKKWWQP